MAAGKMEIKHNFTGLTDFLIVRWFKNTAPLSPASGLVNGVTVTQVVYPAPHSEEALVITEVDPVMHTVRFYQSSDGTTLDAEIPVSLTIDASQSAVNVLEVYFYVVGRGETGDPVQGDTGLRDSRLLNKDYIVEERGTGTMIAPPDVSAEYTDRSDDGGGFDWIGGKVFNTDAVYTVWVQETQDIPVSPSAGGGYNDIVVITANTTFDIPTHAGRVMIADGATSFVFDIPLLSGLGDCTFRLMQTGFQQNTTLQLASGDTMDFRGVSVNKVILGRGEWIECIIKNNAIYVVTGQTGHEAIGSIRWLYVNSVQANTIPALNPSGTQRAEADWPRISQFLDTITTVSLAAWSASKGKWGRGSGQFIVPDLTDQFIRAVSTDMGRLEADMVGPHTHPDVPFKIGDVDRGSSGSLFSLDTNGSTGTNTGTETRPKNVGLVPHICI